MANSIDIVIPWVDGNDSEWQKEKEKFSKSVDGDKRIIRYRDWEMLQYWFRGVEKFAPWVRKVHFVTWGHLPKWLNVDNERLNIVRHEDYIPEKYLPTFSSHSIELNMFRIEDLSEKFIYANDDTYFIKNTKEEDFFERGLPKDCALEAIHQFRKGGIDHIIANDLEIVNDHFNKREVLKKNYKKWYSINYKKGLLKNLYLSPCGNFVGFENPHLPQPFLKTTFKKVWAEEYDALDKTCSNKFRNINDVNQWLVRYWCLAEGEFIPGEINTGKFFVIGRDDKEIEDAILKQNYKMICLSDDDENISFEFEKEKICKWFEHILPEKSSFEI
ncbi:hypothetical protein C6W64_012525 [Blautia sp. SG-772]|nr:hypothetical protein C6W64_012525 [Blautia sp. SG-772]